MSSQHSYHDYLGAALGPDAWQPFTRDDPRVGIAHGQLAVIGPVLMSEGWYLARPVRHDSATFVRDDGSLRLRIMFDVPAEEPVPSEPYAANGTLDGHGAATLSVFDGESTYDAIEDEFTLVPARRYLGPDAIEPED